VSWKHSLSPPQDPIRCPLTADKEKTNSRTLRSTAVHLFDGPRFYDQLGMKTLWAYFVAKDIQTRKREPREMIITQEKKIIKPYVYFFFFKFVTCLVEFVTMTIDERWPPQSFPLCSPKSIYLLWLDSIPITWTTFLCCGWRTDVSIENQYRTIDWEDYWIG